MVSIVSTAQASLINEDNYSKRYSPANSRSCGIWGTAFCCLNLRKSVFIITIIYGIIYLFYGRVSLRSNQAKISINNKNNSDIESIQILTDLRHILSGNTFIKIQNFENAFLFIIKAPFKNAFFNYLEVSRFIYLMILIFGVLSCIFNSFWITAVLLGLIWIDSIKSICGTLYFTYLLFLISKFWYNKIYIISISALILLNIFLFSYYLIQIVYSLYLVQLAGGRGDEYVPYYKLRRIIQNKNIHRKSNENEQDNTSLMSNQNDSSNAV